MSDTDCCIDLIEPKAAVPPYPLLDHRCPTYVLLKELNCQGWERLMRTVVHVDGTKVMDARGLSASTKAYFQVLLSLGS